MQTVAPCSLERFIAIADVIVATSPDAETRAHRVSEALPSLLVNPEWLAPEHREGYPDRYRQHVVHVGDGYSIVALVWDPGQETCIHDHVCWCVVGVYQGAERETRYQLRQDGDDRWLVEVASGVNPVGTTCYLVPPDENIHKVQNDTNDRVISIHVYGADIGVLGTSINERFDLPIQDRAGPSVAWRPV